jgi:MFS family permease
MTETIKRTLRDSTPFRWLMLLMVSVLMFATYWFQDFLSGLKPLMESQMGITSSQFGTLTGMTSFANMLGMIILGGIILDKWGIRLTAFIFGGVTILGTVIMALGANGVFSADPGSRLTVMIVGRVLFGVGLETTCVLVVRTIVKWFKGYELALAMAINMGIGRLGSALGTAISPDIAGKNPPTAITFAAGLIVLGVLFYFIYLIFDVRIDRQLKAEAASGEDEKFRFSDLGKLVTDRSFITIALLCVAFYSAVFPFMQYAPDLLVNKFGFSYTLPESAKIVLFGSSSLGNVSVYFAFFIFGILFSILPTYLKKRSARLGAMIGLVALFASLLYLLRGYLTVWLHNGPKAAALIPLGTILFTPIFGRMVDKKGKAASIMMLGSLLLIFAHLSLSVFNSEMLCYLGLLSLGIAFSLVPAAMWPSVAKIVPERRLGTAYATMYTVQNWGLGLFNKGIGWMLDKANPDVVAKIQQIRGDLAGQGLNNTQISEKIDAMRQAGTLPLYNYTVPILTLVGCGIVAIFLAFYLKKASAKQGYGLELPSNKK